MITVSAPGNSVECANGTGRAGSQRRTGISVAAPAVAGLVAHFLSLANVGPMLRQRAGSIRQVVKQYLTDMAYIRTDSRVKSIWNGLDGGEGSFSLTVSIRRDSFLSLKASERLTVWLLQVQIKARTYIYLGDINMYTYIIREI